VSSLLWPLLRRLYPSVVVDGIEIVDVGLRVEALDTASELFKGAFDYLRGAGPETWAMVSRNLRRVAIVSDGFAQIAVHEGKYGTTFQGHEGRNSFYLACRLLWVAKYISLSRRDVREPLTERERRDASFDAAMAFASLYDEDEEWIRYLERERMRDIRAHHG
jgi:hypothetical protein